MNIVRGALFCSATAALLVAGPAAVAIEPAQDSDAIETQVIEACKQAAAEVGAASWSCANGQLAYTLPGDDSLSEPRLADVPGMRSINPYRDSKKLAEPGFETMSISSTDYDGYWCENTTSTCTRYPNSYIAITKGNVWYGEGSNYVGQFDVVLKVSLNGRQPIFYGTWDHDSGPAVNFSSQRINCVKDQTFDGNCGQHTVSGDGAFWLNVGGVYNTGAIYNSRLD
ncbi:hypothetical protein, partial [Actinotalea ferrariae]|uniref:hypothetical protein n=1 Tax=Actinotalea ferrariae TaxID=1386098 RepID=UPI0012DE9174